MIVDIEKTMALMENVRAALPLEAFAIKELRSILQGQPSAGKWIPAPPLSG